MPQPPSRQTVSFKIGDQPVPGYRLARELGRGTFGVVWLAVTENGFERALKVVNLEQKGGKKEFRALRLIKDRKILHGNLLTLIDYWLLDRDGTILSTPNNISVDTHIAVPKTGSSLSQATSTAAGAAKVQVTPLQGTMIPSGEAEGETFNVRDTFQQNRLAETTEEENSQAIWLVVAMELGHKTLHDRQKEYTHEVNAKALTKASRRRGTQVDKQGDTSPGSHTVTDRRQTEQQSSGEDDLSPLSADEVLPYMEQAARGLDYLHRCEIVHRDVKPQNIMLVGDVAKVCDYGLASELGDIRATTNAFTLPYAAPEAINKNQPLPASDQYSLAVTYVELRTGRWPFISNTSTAVYAAKDTGVHHLKFIRNRNVRTVLKKALAKKPQDRYPSCGDFVKQLAKAETTRFNLFATAQAVLACFAIFTVLLAAAATHPDVWSKIKPYLPQPVIPSPDPQQFNLADYQNRLKSAERLLEESRQQEALLAFNDLQQFLAQLPEQEVGLKNDTILGLARAQVGANDILKHADRRRLVLTTIEPLDQAAGPPLQGKQTLRLHYLKVLAQKVKPSAEVGPDSQVAKDSLFDWERQLWKDALVTHQAPELKDLLDLVIDKRKEGSAESLQQAREALEQLLALANNVAEIPAQLRHQIAMEEMHLIFSRELAQQEDNLRALRDFLQQDANLDPRLVDRAQLLQLLILHAMKSAESLILNPEILQTISVLRPELLEESRLKHMHFSDAEIEAIQAIRDQFKGEVQQSTEALSEEVSKALPHLIAKRDAFQLLCERVRAHLTNTSLKEAQLPAVKAAWLDLRQYVERDYQALSLGGREQQDAIQAEADISLEVSFADPQAEPAAALQDFVDRVVKSGDGVKWFQRLLKRAEQDPAWIKTAAGPLQSLLKSPPDDLAENRQLGDWKSKVESLLLRDVLHADPSDEVAIANILAALARDAGDGKGPLPTLISVECEMLASSSPTTGKMREWESKINKAVSSIGGSDPDLQMYGSFVRARLLAASNNVFEQEEAAKAVGDLLKRDPLPSWFTSTRRQGAGDIFAIGAIKALKVDDQDILRFADLSLASSSQLMNLQNIANEAGVQTPALQAVAGIIHATKGEQADWQKVQEQIDKGFTDPRTMALFEAHGAARLLEYVRNLAALRAVPPGAALDPKIAEAFHRVLMTRQDSKYVYFSFADASQEHDEGVLQNIINPVLLHPGIAKDGATPAKELAFLWGAKARLLQRSPLIVSVDPAKQTDLRDSTTVAVTLSHAAFDRARKLDNNLNYLVGYGRTLAALPADSLVRDDRLQRLSAIVDEHDPEGTSPNLSMRFLSAYVLRFRSYEKSDVTNIRAAAVRYEAVLKELPPDDPFELDSLCREGLSDIHLRLAFLNHHVTTQEVRALLAGQEPPSQSKAFHLQLAVKYATEATQSGSRDQKENAYTALANAYEDYAYYLGLTDYYAKSKDAFGFAISSARERGLPVAKAQMNYGRCLYRYAIDPYAGFASREERIEILNLAVSQLNEAVESGKLRPSDQVEASFWLAVDKRAIGTLSDGATKLTMNEEALAHFHQASESATKYGLADMQLLTLAQESEATIALYGLYGAAKDHIRQPRLLKQAQAIDETAFQIFAKSPATANPSQVTTLAGNASLIWRGEAPKRLRWLDGTPAIRAQWESKDTWKFEAICLRLGFAMMPEGKEEVRKARDILATVKDDRLKKQAEARILDFEAAVEYRAFEEIVNNQKDITQERLRQEVEKPLLLYIAAKRFHDEIIDPEVKGLLDRINSFSLTRLKNLSRDLTVAEKKKIQDALTRSPDVEFRKRFFKLCNLSLLTMGTDPKLAPKKNERARLAHDAIKPFYVFSDNEVIFIGLRDLKDKHQVGLDKFENQLKQANVKFDTKPAN